MSCAITSCANCSKTATQRNKTSVLCVANYALCCKFIHDSAMSKNDGFPRVCTFGSRVLHFALGQHLLQFLRSQDRLAPPAPAVSALRQRVGSVVSFALVKRMLHIEHRCIFPTTMPSKGQQANTAKHPVCESLPGSQIPN